MANRNDTLCAVMVDRCVCKSMDH